MIELELEDGRIIEFPDGTTPAAMSRAAKTILNVAPEVTPLGDPGDPTTGAPAAVAPVEAPQVPETPEQPQQRRPSALGRRAEGLGNLIMEGVGLLTGAEQRTPELEALGEVGASPELNDIASLNSLATNAATLLATSQSSIKGIIDKRLDPAIPRSFTQDAKGNWIGHFPSGSYALNKPGFSFQDVPELALQAAALRGGGGAGGLLKKMTMGAIGGAGGAGILELAEEAVGGDEPEITDVIAGGLFGAGGPAMEKALGIGLDLLRGTIRPEAQALIDEAGKRGIDLLKSDVVPPTTAAGKLAQSIGEKSPVAGTGAKRATQQKQRQAAIDKVQQENLDGDFKNVVEDLQASKDFEESRLGKIFGRIGNELSDIGPIEKPLAVRKLDEVRETFNNPAILKSENLLADLQKLTNTMDVPQTYTEFRNVRDGWTRILETIDNQGRSQLLSEETKLFKQIRRAMTIDMKNFERKHLTPREKAEVDKGNVDFQKFQQTFSRTNLKQILDKGDVKPEIVRRSLFTRDKSDIQRLAANLSPQGRAHARAAFISESIKKLEEKGSFNPNRFANEIRRFPETVEALFKGEDRKQLEGLMKVLNATRQAQEAAVVTPTGQQAISVGAALSFGFEPIITALTIGSAGAVSSIYESKTLRNLLLRMDGLPPRSAAFKKTAAEVVDFMNGAAQAAVREGDAPDTPEQAAARERLDALAAQQ